MRGLSENTITVIDNDLISIGTAWVRLDVHYLSVAGRNNFRTILGLDINAGMGPRPTGTTCSKAPVALTWLISLI
jgi:hypothetical protein